MNSKIDWNTHSVSDEVLVTHSRPTLCNPMDCSPVCGILQPRILEWVATFFSRGSSQSRDRTWVSCFAGRFFTIWASREALHGYYTTIKGNQLLIHPQLRRISRELMLSEKKPTTKHHMLHDPINIAFLKYQIKLSGWRSDKLPEVRSGRAWGNLVVMAQFSMLIVVVVTQFYTCAKVA